MINSFIDSFYVIFTIGGMFLVPIVPIFLSKFKNAKNLKKNAFIDIFIAIWMIMWSVIIANYICYYIADMSILDALKNFFSGKLFTV